MSSTSAGVAFKFRQAHHGEWTRPTSGSAASGLISTGLSTRQVRPSTSGSARGVTSPRPKHSFAKPYVLKASHPRQSRWTGYAASHRAVRELQQQGRLADLVELRSSKYLNNLIEQDHRNVESRRGHARTEELRFRRHDNSRRGAHALHSQRAV